MLGRLQGQMILNIVSVVRAMNGKLETALQNLCSSLCNVLKGPCITYELIPHMAVAEVMSGVQM